MYLVVSTKQYRKSYVRLARSGKFPKDEIDFVVNVLASGGKLDVKYRDHALTGEYEGYRECHVKPDLLLIYEIKKKEVVLLMFDIGSHSNLFK